MFFSYTGSDDKVIDPSDPSALIPSPTGYAFNTNCLESLHWHVNEGVPTLHTNSPPIGNWQRDGNPHEIGGPVIDHLSTTDVETISFENGSEPAQIEEESDDYEIPEPPNNPM